MHPLGWEPLLHTIIARFVRTQKVIRLLFVSCEVLLFYYILHPFRRLSERGSFLFCFHVFAPAFVAMYEVRTKSTYRHYRLVHDTVVCAGNDRFIKRKKKQKNKHGKNLLTTRTNTTTIQPCEVLIPAYWYCISPSSYIIIQILWVTTNNNTLWIVCRRFTTYLLSTSRERVERICEE